MYLGLFQKVFEWVLKNIFDPVYQFVSGLLTTVMTWVFEELLAPLLFPVLKEALEFFIDIWKLMVSRQMYLLFTGLLKLVDYLEKAFDVFIGLQDVTYTDSSGVVTSGTLVEVLMQQKTVSTVFWALTLGALGLALLLTIFATAKSAFDLDFENKRPVSKVLSSMMKTFVQFFTVPFLVYFLLKLSAVILKGVTSLLNFGGETTLGRIVFTIASLDAAREAGHNLSDTAAGVDVGLTDSVRAPFYQIRGSGLKDYGRMADVDAVFHLEKFDYLIGFIAAIFLLFTIGVCLIVFVQRIFELIMLYLASPYFVCMIPLDDGEKFSRWREMFVAKCFTGFGSAIGMRLFLMICPLIMGNRIRFGTASSPEMDYMMKLFFLAGGAWAVFKSGSMVTSLLSGQAGAAEAETAATVGGMLYGYTAGKLIAKGQQGLRAAFQPRLKGQGEGGEPKGQGGKEQGRFKGQSPALRSQASRGLPQGGVRQGGSYPYPYGGGRRPGTPYPYGRRPGTPYSYGWGGRPGYAYSYGRTPGAGGPYGYRTAGAVKPGLPRSGAAGSGGAGLLKPGGSGVKPTVPGGKPGAVRQRRATMPARIGEGVRGAGVLSGSAPLGSGKVSGSKAGLSGPGGARPPVPGKAAVRPPVPGGIAGRAGIPGGMTVRPRLKPGPPGGRLARPNQPKPPGVYAPPSTDRFAAARARQVGGANAGSAGLRPYGYGGFRAYGYGSYPRYAGAGQRTASPGTYAPPSTDVFAAARAKSGVSYSPAGRPGYYRMNLYGYGYTVGANGAVVSRSFPKSAVSQGASFTRAPASQYGNVRYGSQTAGQALGSGQDLDSGSASSSGGVSGSSGSTAGDIVNVGTGRNFQVSAFSRPVASVQPPGGRTANYRVNYSDISVRGLSVKAGQQGQAPQFTRTRRNTR